MGGNGLGVEVDMDMYKGCTAFLINAVLVRYLQKQCGSISQSSLLFVSCILPPDSHTNYRTRRVSEW